ncbi:hypothetical protein N9954_06845 [Maribacter sp.]|nr:hypothetical protein [Maribacter sp.]
MKTRHLFLVILIFFSLLGCKNSEPQEIQATLFLDITASNSLVDLDITTKQLREVFGMDQNDRNYGVFRAIVLTETHLGEIVQVKLSQMPMHKYNKYTRKAEIDRFLKKVDSVLAQLKSLERGKRASSIFIPLNKELSRLSQTNAEAHILVYSDFFENSEATLFASEVDFEKFETAPEEMAKRILKTAPLPDQLDRLHMHMIYNPVLESDLNFLRISSWYQQLLEARNAHVTINSTLIL